MKNFRKVLALVLVVATLFSFVAMTASAKTYSDGDKVSYTEAVDVLSAIGILNGYTDGTFRPTNTIARAEMAKMIAVLSNAGDDISDMYASACKFADMTGDAVWAKSYVAYCNQTGIVAGRNATTFDPYGKVTGIETAKMLLCTLGFDAKEQGYVGTNWKVNVLRDAKNFGLLNGFAAGYDPDKAISREEAAQMMLNALCANIVVGTLSDNIIKISNALYHDYKDLGLTLIDAEKYGWVVLYGNVVVSNKPLASIYKNLDVEAALDCYGNPGYIWTYTNAKGTVLFQKFYGFAADYSYTTTASLATDLKEEINAGTYTYTLYENGNTTNGHVDAKLTEANMKTVAGRTGKGVETHVYVDDASKQVIITTKQTYIGKVADVSTRYETFDIVSADGTIYANDADNSAFQFENGDMVLYWVCGGYYYTLNADGDYVKSIKAENYGQMKANMNYLHDAKIAEPVKATVSYARYDTSKANATFTADGKKYEYAFCYGYYMNTKLPILNDGDVKTTKYIYTDLFGYVMYVSDYAEEHNYEYAYFVEKTWDRDIAGENQDGVYWKADADYVDFNGDLKKDAAVDYDMTDEMDKMFTYVPAGATTKKQAGLLAKYEVVDGVIEHVANATVLKGSEYSIQLNANDPTIVKGVLYGSDTTKYLVRYYDYSKAEYVYTAWTGYRNIDKDYGTTALGTDTYVQYFDEDKDEVAEYVFVDATYTSASKTFYLMGKAYNASWDAIYSKFENYNVYFALVDGKESVVAYNGSMTTAGATFGYGLYKGNVTALGVNLTVENDHGEADSYPLYVVVDYVAEDYSDVEGVLEIKDGLVKLVDKDATGGTQPTITYGKVSKNGVKVIDVIYDNSGDYVGFETTENVLEDELRIVTNGKIWIEKDEDGICTIYREVKESR